MDFWKCNFVEDSREFRRCSPCEGPECIAWDYMAWDCCHITGAVHVVSRKELFAAVAMAKSQALGILDKKTAPGSDTEGGGGRT